jgi:predicted small metal-binding protein
MDCPYEAKAKTIAELMPMIMEHAKKEHHTKSLPHDTMEKIKKAIKPWLWAENFQFLPHFSWCAYKWSMRNMLSYQAVGRSFNHIEDKDAYPDRPSYEANE